MAKHSLAKSSIGRKLFMALSALFLIIFLLQHLLINLLSVFSPDAFNEVSLFMSENPLIQFLMQPILIFAVVYHFISGFVLEVQNKKARGSVGYAMSNRATNSSWVSRNMIISGGVILLFLLLHFVDFWIPTIRDHYFCALEGFGQGNYFYAHLVSKFSEWWRVALYVVAFILLMLHLLHGFQSAFQSIGFNHKKYTPCIKALGKVYAIVVPLGFIFIALYHFLTNL